MLLTGNRFSAFYSFGSFFALPLSAVIAAEVEKEAIQLPILRGSGTRLENARVSFSLVAIVSLAAIVVGGRNLSTISLMFVAIRKQDIQSQFLERLLVQPSELGYISADRVFTFGHWQPDHAFDFLFQAPLDSNKNTTPQYLMLETIGEPRTSEDISSAASSSRADFPRFFSSCSGRSMRGRSCSLQVTFRRR